jgi:pimeloyl-ACP methyl ester carboxylesterase
MIEHSRGRIDYDVVGAGPTIVLVPGSCSTGAAWRPVVAAWNGQFRCITTSLLGYGGTAERRAVRDTCIWHEADVLEAVIERARGAVHLVGHSFGGLVSLAVALRRRVSLTSLTVVEAPAMELLRSDADKEHYRAFRRMTERYFASYAAGEPEAIAIMIDFYGGVGTFASWPARVREYAAETTAVNILDWATAYGFPLTADALAAIKIPVLVIMGGKGHPAVQRANALLAEGISGASAATIAEAAHFAISTHPDQVGQLIAQHVRAIEARQRSYCGAV